MIPESMKAIVQTGYGDTDTWRLSDRPVPTPGKGEVLLRVDAAGIDRGTWHLMVGLPKLLRLAFGLRSPRQPVPGLDAAGTVVALGPDAGHWQVGDRVFGVARGSFAEYAAARADKLAPHPASLTPTEAAVVGISGLTALHALDAAHLETGQRVLVIGASGGVGSMAVKLAVARGAEVTAVCSAAKAEAVASWGAQRVIDHARIDVTTEQTTYDAILQIAGGQPLKGLRSILTPRGTIVFVGDETGGEWTGGYGRPMRIALRMLFARQRYVMLAANESGKDLERLGVLVDDGALRPHVQVVVPLAEAAAGMTQLSSGKVVGKVAVQVSQS